MTNTAGCNSRGLSGDARSRRPEARRPGSLALGRRRPGAAGSGARSPRVPGAPARATAGEGSHTTPLSPGGCRGQRKGRARGGGRSQPRCASARAPRAALSPRSCVRNVRGRGQRGGHWPQRRSPLPRTGGPGAPESDPPHLIVPARALGGQGGGKGGRRASAPFHRLPAGSASG